MIARSPAAAFSLRSTSAAPQTGGSPELQLGKDGQQGLAEENDPGDVPQAMRSFTLEGTLWRCMSSASHTTSWKHTA